MRWHCIISLVVRFRVGHLFVVIINSDSLTWVYISLKDELEIRIDNTLCHVSIWPMY